MKGNRIRMKCTSKAAVFLAIIPLVFSQAANALVLSVDFISDSADRELSGAGSSQTFNADSKGFRIRLGTSSIEKNRFEFYFSTYDVDKEGEFNDKNEWDLGANYVFTFRELPLIPFVKLGLGIGQADTDMQFVDSDGDNTDKVSNVHFNLGGGLTYALTDKVSITGGLEYTARKWQDIDVGIVTVETSDSVVRLGLGVDFKF